VLLEKILSAFPEVGQVYVLIRGKKNHSFEDRVHQLRNEPIFTKGGRVDVKNFSKIVGIEGRIGDNGLEISDKDRTTLTERVNVIFHVASTLRFDERLDIPMKSIFLGTKSMLSLADDTRNLSSFVYVSTAYANSNLLMPEEKVYDMDIDADSVLSLYENNSKDDVDKLVRKKYFGGRPNTYCFTKALTENYIRKHYNHLPIAIARPSVVTASLSEPVPGYCDSPSAISFGIIYQGLGICRYYPLKEAALVDIIPVDISINCLLIIAREIGMKTNPSGTVYNVSSASHWPLTHKHIADWKLKAIKRSPPATALRPVPHTTTEISQFQQKLLNFSEFSFAVVMDLMERIRGNKRRIMKLTRFIQSIRDEQASFYQNSWVFPRRNMDDAVARLSDEDRKLLPAVPIVKDTEEYFYNYWMSLREMVIGESPNNIDAAQRRQKRLTFASVALPFATATTACIVVSVVEYL
ncbi:Fatty acyl-CoA reductase 1, partial [Pseudolycoriella hygida]